MEKSSVNGYSLVEIMIAIMIVTITIIVIAFFSRNSIRNYSTSYYTETAYMIADEKLTEINASPFPVNGNDTKSVDDLDFNRMWVVTKNDTLNRVKVTVSWSLMGKDQSIVLTGAIR